MSRDQDYMNNISLKLSEVLSDIGVNERIVLKRRRMVMLMERMWTATARLQGCHLPRLRVGNVYSYSFGSQSEGTTTLGLKSDYDELLSYNDVSVIQDLSQWRPDMPTLLMIQDETTSPGYCLLQEWIFPSNRHRVIDRKGRVLHKNSFFQHTILTGYIQHGPAHSPATEPGCYDHDYVAAYHCESWPLEAQPWLERQGIGGWPTEEMKRYCVDTGYFVVPVASKSGQNKDTEWRISTSHAERCLMYSMNMTQIRSYVLMKMILKTFINPKCDGVISSYMCKTVLFHCIENTHSHQWQENNLLPCLTNCLLKLQHFIREVNCPHFIILENNLMAEKNSNPVKHQLLEILQHIIQSEGHILLEIPFDEFGARLQDKMNVIPTAIYPAPTRVSSVISGDLLVPTARKLNTLYEELLNLTCGSNEMAHLKLSEFIFSLVSVYQIPDVSCSMQLKKSACELLFPLLCSSLGSVIASSDIHMNNTISPEALWWLSAGLNSDVSSGRLKLASALYCGGETERTEFVLRNSEDLYEQHIVSVCSCNGDKRWTTNKPGFHIKCNNGNEEMIKQIMAFCVRFMRCEIDCVPKELQYEMFRSTEDDLLHRDEDDYWMDWAAVDSLPYLYFLQYKTYGRLQRADGQQCALTYLATAIDKEPNLHHRETALNLLGQCMEQENRYNDALHCYVRSLNICPRNNAAKIHICRLLNALVNRPVTE